MDYLEAKYLRDKNRLRKEKRLELCLKEQLKKRTLQRQTRVERCRELMRACIIVALTKIK